ncbi:MAG TPA: hypothetical protein VFI39_05845 [Gemmatimonadales bacterium]|nr:hypothetical protein [Gemmatimonadales bacterium]
MCYLLRLASPLTLSEVRSMLPAGMTADLRDASELRPWRTLLPETQTVAALLHGGCSCDLVRPDPVDAKADGAEIRKRYRALGASRTAVIDALDRHARNRTLRRYAAGHWPVALNRFVAEHARNAGESGYRLTYEISGGTQVRGDAEQPLRPSATAPLRLPVPARHDHSWLVPDRVLIVTP